MRRRALVVLSTLALTTPALLMSWAGPAGAVGTFRPQKTVVSAPCAPSQLGYVHADAVTDSNGVTHGFVSYQCPSGTISYYIERAAGSWTATRSPYAGDVLGVTYDTTGTYLLYANDTGTYITKRSSAGQFTGGHRLSTYGRGAVIPQGDVVAIGGQWWAVWAEQDGTNEFSPTHLYQAHTLGAGHYFDTIRNRQRITGTTLSDRTPSLVIAPGSGFSTGKVVLLWARVNETGAGIQSGQIRVASAGYDGAWSSRRFSGAGTVNINPDLTVSGQHTYAAWVRDGYAVAADNRSGTWTSTRLGAVPTLFQPRVAFSGGQLNVAFTGNRPTHPFVYERTASGWSHLDLAPTATSTQHVMAATSYRHRATVLWLSGGTGRLYARNQ